MIENLEDIIKQWLWKYLVEKQRFESHKDIFYEKTEYIMGGKDSELTSNLINIQL